MFRLALGFSLFLFTVSALKADPVHYILEADKSSVGFTYRFNNAPTKGTMPVTSAEVVIDFAALPASNIDIRLNVKKARAGFIFATEALRGKTVLDAANHPHIRFVSTKISRTGDGAKVVGLVTIRGVTKPLTLMARFYRQKGSAPTDLSRLAILLTGSVSRSAFGATGYPDLVGDRIDLRIVAHIHQVK